MTKDQRDCRCGSGKTERDCCGASVSNLSDLRVTKIKKLLDASGPKLLRFVLDNFSEDLLKEAFDEFVAWDESYSFDAEDPICTAFFPWMVFNWLPGISLDENASLPEDATVCELFQRVNSDRIGSTETCVLEAANRKPFSFFEVDRSRENTLEVIDLLTLEAKSIVASPDTRYLSTGDIIYAKNIYADAHEYLIGIAPVVIPPEFKKKVVQLRYQITKIGGNIDLSKLAAFDNEIRETYFDLEENLLVEDSVPSKNSDGQELRPQKVVFLIENTQEAFEILKEFAPSNEPHEDILACAERDDQGQLFSVSFPWTLKIPISSENTIETMLGYIRIEGANLSIVVNSDQRANTAQAEIKRLMGRTAQFKTRIVDINDEEYNFFSDIYGPVDLDEAVEKEFDS